MISEDSLLTMVRRALARRIGLGRPLNAAQIPVMALAGKPPPFCRRGPKPYRDMRATKLTAPWMPSPIAMMMTAPTSAPTISLICPSGLP